METQIDSTPIAEKSSTYPENLTIKGKYISIIIEMNLNIEDMDLYYDLDDKLDYDENVKNSEVFVEQLSYMIGSSDIRGQEFNKRESWDSRVSFSAQIPLVAGMRLFQSQTLMNSETQPNAKAVRDMKKFKENFSIESISSHELTEGSLSEALKLLQNPSSQDKIN